MPKQPPQRHEGIRSLSGDSLASVTPSSLGPHGSSLRLGKTSFDRASTVCNVGSQEIPMKNETIRVGQIAIKFLIESADSNGSVAIFEFTVPVGAKVPLPHYHKQFDETIYGVEGVLTFTVDGKPFDIGAGDSCFVPRGAVHGFTNLSRRMRRHWRLLRLLLLVPTSLVRWRFS